jgi:hypothetical protein
MDDYGSPITRCGPIDYEKDPDETVDYVFNVAPLLGTDTIVACEFLTPDAGLTLGSTSFDDTTATAWISGGSRGLVYRLTARFITAAGRKFDRTVRILIREQ